MTFEAIANAHRTRFGTEIEDGQNVAVQYDNDGEFVIPEDTKWIRFSPGFLGAQQISAGTDPKFRITGLFSAQIMVPIHDGDKAAMELADAIVTAFRATTADGIVYRTPAVGLGHRSEPDSKWWQVNVTCPWYANQT